MPEVERRTIEMLICPQLCAAEDDEYAEWDSVIDPPDDCVDDENEHRRTALMYNCHFPVGCIVKKTRTFWNTLHFYIFEIQKPFQLNLMLA